MMSKEDETFWAAARRICSAWFVEDIKTWASAVDDHAAHEHGDKLAGLSCEEWENWIMTLLECNLTGDSWRLRKWAGVDISSRMSKYLSSPDDDKDPYTMYSLNGESVRDWMRRIIPQVCDGSFSNSVISVSSGNSSMSHSSLTGSEKEVMDMTIRTAQNFIIQAKAMLSRQNADIRRYWAERKSFIKIINQFRLEMGDSPLGRVQDDSSPESSVSSLEYSQDDTSNLSETCRNYLMVRDSILKDTQILQQQDESRKRQRSLDVSIEEISPPAKRTIKERLGSRDSIAPSAPANTPSTSELNLSTQFTVENESFKDKSPTIVNISSSSSGVASDTSDASISLSPTEGSR